MNTVHWAGIFVLVIFFLMVTVTWRYHFEKEREVRFFKAKQLQRELIDALSWALNSRLIRLSEFDEWVEWVKHEQRIAEFMEAYEFGVDVQYKLPAEIRALYCAKIANQPFLNEVA